MSLKKYSLLSLLVCSLWAVPVSSSPLKNGADIGGDKHLLASADSDYVKAKKDGKVIGVAPEVVSENVADIRLVSDWMASAYRIPSRVPEELLLAGYSYGDVIVALSLMDYGASLNEVLEKRCDMRWAEVARSVNISTNNLPAIINALMIKRSDREDSKAIRFYPDVRSGLSERLHLPSCSPTVPDSVAIKQFDLSDEEIANIRRVLTNPNNATPEMLLKPAGRSLCVADWLIASTLSKYKPNPLEAFLVVRIGEVVEWGDIANIFSIDPRILLDGPLAPVYAVLTGTYKNVVVPTFKRPYYPEDVPERYNLTAVSGEQRDALRWLMSLHYKENTSERDILAKCGYSLREEALCLAISRLALVDVQTVIDEYKLAGSWAYIVNKYELDLTGEDSIECVLGLNDVSCKE